MNRKIIFGTIVVVFSMYSAIECTVLTRGYNPQTGKHVASTRPLPAGFFAEASWNLLNSQKSSSVPLYECSFHKHSFLSMDIGCEGQVPLGWVGYIHQNPISGAVPMYRCFSSKLDDHMVSTQLNCEHPDYKTEGLLGYAVPH